MQILEGVTVVDFTQAYSGPFCTMQLADFGAKVIKIERPGIGDQSREWSPIEKGHSGYYAAVNRNKKSLSLDIATEEGAKIAKEMLRHADIVVENFKVGTMEKMGLAYEDVRKINPGIIYASLSGFGQDGDLRMLAAYDNIVQSMSGIMDMTGFPDGVPTRVGPAVGDSFTGLNMAFGILLAYYHKLLTGQGQRVDVAMFDTIFGILESPILFSTLLGKASRRCGNNDAATLVPYDVYQCRDGYFSAGIASDSGWPKFCEALSMEELIRDDRFDTNEKRCQRYEELTSLLAPFFLEKSKDELTAVFAEAGVPHAPVLTVPEVMGHPQIAAREMVVDFSDPGVGEYQAMGNAMKLSETPARLRTGAPLLGQDTEAVLGELGYSLREIQELRRKQIV